MNLRHRAWIVLVGIAVGTVDVALRGADDEVPSPGPVLSLRLNTSDNLPALSRTALIRETDSIWREANVRLRWLAADAGSQPTRPLRVLVTTRTVAAAIDGPRWAVGELVRFKDSAIAVASIAGAARIVDESQPYQLIDQPAMRQYRLGVVLGRAVAHEIGHYLLQTNTHAAHGLMRATIDAREFADLRSGSFRLDREAVAHLAARATRGVAPADTEESEFSYPKD